MSSNPVFIPQDKYPMVWSLDEWCNEHAGREHWLRNTKWTPSTNLGFQRPVGQIYEFEDESIALLFALKWA